MNRLAEIAGVDLLQWKALTRVFIRTDFGPMLGAFGRVQAGRARLGFALTALFYGLTSGAIGLLAFSSPDRLLGGTIIASYTALLVGANMLLIHAGTVISPEDHAILGYRPVTSRTYLAVRVTTIFVHTGVTAALMGFMPFVEFALAHELTAGLAILATVTMTTVATTIGIVAGYAQLLRLVGPARLRRAVTYAQLLSTMAIYFGLALVSRASLRHLLDGVAMSRAPWILLYPGVWFGSYLDLASAPMQPIVLAAAALSVVAVVLLGGMLGGRLSLAYAGRLASLATAAAASDAAAPRRTWAWPGFATGEARAVGLLVRTQFKHDNRFRLGVLTFIPVTLFYLYSGTREGPIADPFLAAHGGSGNALFLQVLLYFLPASLKQLVTSSDAYRASWIFHVTPADRTRLVIAARNAITLLVIVPYLLCLGVLFAWQFHDIGHAATHVLFLGLMSQIVFQTVVLLDPRLPFADPPNRSRDSGVLVGIMAFGMIGGTIVYFLATTLIYPSALRTALMLGVFIAASLGLDRLTRWRIGAKVGDLAYLT